MRHASTARRGFLAAMALSATAFLGLPTHGHAADAAPVIRVATGSDPGFAYLTVAVKKGFFQREGINAELKVFDDGNLTLDNLLTGAAQIGSTSEVGSMTRRAKGGALAVVASGAQSTDFAGVVGSNSIAIPKDLEGKTVGVTKGSGAHLYFGYLARKMGLDLTKVNLRFIQPPEAVAALSRGDIDAMVIWEPMLSRIPTMVRSTHIITRGKQDQAYTANMYLLFSDDLLKNDELARKCMRAILAAADWIPGNWDEAVKIVADANHMKPAEAENVMKLNTWLINFDRQQFVRNFDGAGEFAKAQGLMQQLPSYDGFLRPDVLKAVAPQRVK